MSKPFPYSLSPLSSTLSSSTFLSSHHKMSKPFPYSLSPLPSTLSSSTSTPPNGEEMSLLSDLKLGAQILSLLILIIALILALRKFTTNNTGTGTETFPGSDNGVTNSSSQDIQLIALNVNPV